MMMNLQRPIVPQLAAVLLASLALTATAAAQGDFGTGFQPPSTTKKTVTKASDLVKVGVETDRASIGPGETVEIAVIFTIEPEWHIYWQNPGAAGAPTEILVEAPTGFRTGDARFPRPTAFDEPEGTTFGYAHETVIIVPVTAPAGRVPETIELAIDVHYLVCKDRCIIGHAPVKITLDGRSSGKAATHSTLVREYRDRVPETIPAAPASYVRGGTILANDHGRFSLGGTVPERQFVVAVLARGHRTAEFFPLDVPGVRFGAAVIQPRGKFIDISVPFTVEPQNAEGPLVLGGVIGLGDEPTDPSIAFAFPLDDVDQRETQP